MALGLRELVAAAGIFLAAALWRSSRLPVARVVLVGDSLSAGASYRDDLAASLGVPISTYAFPGKGSAAIAELVPWSRMGSPTHVVILAGVNDLASGRGIKGAQEGLRRLVERVRGLGVTPVLVELTPWAGYSAARKDPQLIEQTRQVNAWIRSVGVRMVPTSSLGDAQGRLLPQYDAGDGLHLNSNGQRSLAALVERAIQ